MTRRKPRRGPVPGTTGAGRTELLRVRVSPEELAAYVAAAALESVPLSEWVRGRLALNGRAGSGGEVAGAASPTEPTETETP